MKSRGQNFLVSAAIADRIVALARLAAGTDAIEIGPGTGILTERIVATPAAHIALVELDPRLAARLEDRFARDSRLSVVNADFLELDLRSLIKNPPVTVLGNLPFNAASAILRKLDDHSGLIARMVLMFQREVAERIRAEPGAASYSALSVFTAMYWRIESHFRVAAGSFHPRPKVDAEVLVFSPRETRPFHDSEEHAVSETVRAAFSAPRKTIRNAIAHGLAISLSDAESALHRASIEPGIRAERLALEDFVRLARSFPQLKRAPRDA